MQTLLPPMLPVLHSFEKPQGRAPHVCRDEDRGRDRVWDDGQARPGRGGAVPGARGASDAPRRCGAARQSGWHAYRPLEIEAYQVLLLCVWRSVAHSRIRHGPCVPLESDGSHRHHAKGMRAKRHPSLYLLRVRQGGLRMWRCVAHIGLPPPWTRMCGGASSVPLAACMKHNSFPGSAACTCCERIYGGSQRRMAVLEMYSPGLK
mmetsp:Transcript_121473/g.350707  ORF Transcript_121473/g.350707 Transcript_121473/m.350707 type:complete len:205 (+) Transcript_121473:2114-2728(+)